MFSTLRIDKIASGPVWGMLEGMLGGLLGGLLRGLIKRFKQPLH